VISAKTCDPNILQRYMCLGLNYTTMDLSFASIAGYGSNQQVVVEEDEIASRLLAIETPDGIPLNDEQVDMLLGLNYNQIGYPRILTLEEPGVLYEVANMIMTSGFDNTYRYILNSQPQGPKQLILNQPNMEEKASSAKFDLENYRMRATAIKGIHTCPRCRSRETISSELQTRGGDEGTTITIVCTQCDKKWKRNN